MTNKFEKKNTKLKLLPNKIKKIKISLKTNKENNEKK